LGSSSKICHPQSDDSNWESITEDDDVEDILLMVAMNSQSKEEAEGVNHRLVVHCAQLRDV
jgi:hypothetical protein